MRQLNIQTGQALAAFLYAAIGEFEGSTAAGLHPMEIALAIGSALGGRLGASEVSDDPAQVDQLVQGLLSGLARTLEVSRESRIRGSSS